MKYTKLIYALLCVLLTCSICACSGEVLQQGSQQQNSGQLTQGQLGSASTPGSNPGTLPPSDAFDGAEHLLDIRVPKTGKSDCILIRLDDTVILMDTADADDYGEIADMLESLGISRIDYLILTHFDNDHIGSAAKIVEDFEVAEVYMPNYVRDSGLYRSLMESLDEAASRTTVHKLNDDTEIALPTGKLWINVSRVYPELSHELPIPQDSMDNDLSLICGLSLGEFSALFMGDAEKARCEDFAAQAQYAVQYDFVKLPHHGNQNKALREILARCDVKYGVICTDAFVSVETELVNVLLGMGAQIFYSYNGTMLLRTDGTTVECLQ